MFSQPIPGHSVLGIVHVNQGDELGSSFCGFCVCVGGSPSLVPPPASPVAAAPTQWMESLALSTEAKAFLRAGYAMFFPSAWRSPPVREESG